MPLLLTLGLVVGCGGEPDSTAPRDARPNVVLIIIDTLRASGLGAYGMYKDTSPEIDALASRGVLFEKVVAQCTWTRPSVGSILTGLYPRQLGLYTEKKEILPDRAATLAEVFQIAGYNTIGATANPHLNTFYNFQQGFDRYLDSNVRFDWMPESVASGVRGEGDAWLATADEIFRYLLEQIEPPAEGPFFLQVDVMDVHEFHDGKVRYGKEFDHPFEGVRSSAMRRYLQAIRSTSAAIGRFVEQLSSQPGFEDTLFILTSDHGESFGEHTDLASPTWHGFLVYESQTLVPLIFFSTGELVPIGVRIPGPVRLIDLMPTVLDLAGLPTPPGIPGVSLVPLMTDAAAIVGLPEAMVVETRFRRAEKIAAYTSEWRYVVNRDQQPGTSPVELQAAGQLENGASTDLSADNPEVSIRLAKFLERWEAEFPAAEPIRQEGELSQEEMEQLRALGYLD